MEKKQLPEKGTIHNSLTPESISMLCKLAGGIAHDYNNILTVILGNLTLARSYSNLDAEILEIIIDVEKATQKAKEITESLIEFSKNRNMEYKAGNLRDIIFKVSREHFSPQSATIRFLVQEKLPPLMFDHFSLSLAFSNIFKFIKSESDTHKNLKIEIANTTNKQGTWQQITITDTNLVLLNDRITTLFTPHFSIKKEDFGIGLIAAYALILKQRGTLTVSSEVDQGTVFTICMPVE